MNNLELLVVDDKLVVESRQVAELTGKKHFHLVRDIENYIKVINQNPILVSDSFFLETSYNAGTGKNYKCYRLTRKGCDLVANKMTGEKGILFTALYVEKFHEMEQALYANAIKLQKETLARYDVLTEKHNNLVVEKSNLVSENQKLKPKSEYCDTVLKAKDAMAVTVIAKDYGMSATRFNTILNRLGVQYKCSGTWVLTKEYQDRGFTKTKTYVPRNYKGRKVFSHSHVTTLWKQKGRLFLYNLLKGQGILPLIER